MMFPDLGGGQPLSLDLVRLGANLGCLTNNQVWSSRCLLIIHSIFKLAAAETVGV